MQNHQLINQTSGDVEYYTDPRIIETARKVMGRIGLDPASSEAANKVVKADAWFGIPDNSLERAWCDEVWMNHPFTKKEEACQSDCQKHLTSTTHRHHSFEWFGNAAWIDKLMTEYRSGNVSQACCITYAVTSERWFQPLLRHPQCFLCPRTNYYLPDGTIKKGVTKGSVVTYMGPDVDKFAANFQSLGTIKVPYRARLPYGPCQCAICQDGMVDYWCQNCQDWFRAEQTPVHAPESECPKCNESNTYEADTE